MNDDIFVVIRSVGERTEKVCTEIAQSQLSSNNQLIMIKGLPFAEAHMESIHLALDSKANWALFLDADVLLKNDAIETMLKEAKKVTFPFFQFNFRILDHEFDGESYGVHFYSTKYFDRAMSFRESATSSSRPEYQVCYEMANHEDIPSISSETVVALHGYEQYYSDIYRTTFVRCVRNRRHLDYFIRRYTDGYFIESPKNFDHKFMFWGMVHGMRHGYDNDKAPLEKSFYKQGVDKIFAELNIEEKKEFLCDANFVERVFENYEPTSLYLSNRQWLCPESGYTLRKPDRSLKRRVIKLTQLFLNRIKKSIKVLISDQ
jgi:hypothetical protein